jgi:hypothetical protein
MEVTVTEPCPLDVVHNRLEDCHRLWHQVLQNYHTPPDFRTYLNSAIQAFRNVTFVLQNKKHNVPQFAQWYEGWRDRLRADPIMRWIVDARNRVVKEGDLVTASEARVQVLAGYEEPPVRVLEISPSLPLEAIVSRVLQETHDDWVSKYGTVVVERVWRVKDLPDHDVLESLCHAYGVMAELLYSAHIQMGLSDEQARDCILCRQSQPEHRSRPSLRWLPPCMIDFKTARSIAYRISSKQKVTPISHLFDASRIIELETVLERYGGIPVPVEGQHRSLRHVAEYTFELAKTVLEKDGYHLPLALLLDSDFSYNVASLNIEDRADKYLVFRELARQVRIAGAIAVIVISEFWVYPADAMVRERSEALALTLLSKDAESFAWFCPFTRQGSSIVIGERIEQDVGDLSFLDPIRRVWSADGTVDD